MTHSLREVMRSGTGVAANPNDGTQLAGKTGTTDDRIHTWMAGYSSAVATATWVGNVVGLDPSERKECQRPSGFEHSTCRVARCHAVANQKYEATDFTAPNPRYVQPTILRVPNVEGFDVETAKVQLIANELNVQIVEREVSSTQPAGTVAYTLPEFGSEVPRGSIIQVFISAVASSSSQKSLDLALAEGFSALEAMGFIPTFPQPSQTQYLNKCNALLEDDAVYATVPAAGEPVLMRAPSS
jgi:membrane peptidoglycan carboxypeptidase